MSKIKAIEFDTVDINIEIRRTQDDENIQNKMPNIWKMLLFGFITCFSFVELLCFVFFFNLCIVYYSCVGKSFSSLMALRARSTCVCVSHFIMWFSSHRPPAYAWKGSFFQALKPMECILRYEFTIQNTSFIACMTHREAGKKSTEWKQSGELT